MSHEAIDQRSLEMHRAVVDRLRENPELLDAARQSIYDALRRRDLDPKITRAYAEWMEILDGRTPEEIQSLIIEDSDEGRRLRQSSPFTNLLSTRQRLAIRRNFRDM